MAIGSLPQLRNPEESGNFSLIEFPDELAVDSEQGRGRGGLAMIDKWSSEIALNECGTCVCLS